MDEMKKQKIQQELSSRGIDANPLFKRYQQALPESYWEMYSAQTIADDLLMMNELSKERPLRVKWVSEDGQFFLRLYQRESTLSLSKLVPLLDHFGVQTLSEHASALQPLDGVPYWIHHFSVQVVNAPEISGERAAIFAESIEDAVFNRIEHDNLNRLILLNGLLPRNILILRAYAKYLQQIRFRFTFLFIEKTLLKHRHITSLLIDYFYAMHSPDHHSQDQATALRAEIEDELNHVSSLDEDNVLRAFLGLISATVRTNFYQYSTDNKPKPYLSFKFNSAEILEMPLPKPKFEIFVYAMTFEGIHLRYSKVSRGGIRWSDRHEDYRTEILGLMKAQRIKNAIIVPSGAKGGFVLKNGLNEPSTPEFVVHCYQDFIRGLLDLTDNIQQGVIVHPEKVHCRDEDDPYLVVAADKGTARFSDVANQLSAEYHFWLGDAFASGGSKGYDHKKMGITARGAWESILHHFREKSIDLTKSTVTVIGIGDMSGDVFGNGMLYTDRVQLIAAFDHRHIFIDPNPNEKTSYKERLRVSQLPSSSWDDYKREYLSAGGGIFSRSAKSIMISEEAQQVLGVNKKEFTPNELIRHILTAPAELLFNGGIGTYVKSSNENHIDVGDRANDAIRINGCDLRVKIVGEGGNLGFTQLGRIEYALQGGLINTDSIDNSAGVDCSDHEVNLKILLNQEVSAGRLSMDDRDALLTTLTDEVAALVLDDNKKQALTLGFSIYHAPVNLPLHQEYLHDLELNTDLNRKLEFLPDDKKILERRTAGIGLTLPELAVVLAYSKISLKQEILKTTIPEDHYYANFLSKAFPAVISQNYSDAMHVHPLRREIIATQCANDAINEMGVTFFYRQSMETGMPLDAIMRAYTIVFHAFSIDVVRDELNKIVTQISLSTYYDMLHYMRRLINLATRWFLKRQRSVGDVHEIIERYAQKIRLLEPVIPTLMSGAIQQYLSHLSDQFVSQGLPIEIAKKIAVYRAIYTVLNIIELSHVYKFDLFKTAKAYFIVGEKINLVWLRDQLGSDNREGHWNALARLHLRDEMDIVQSEMTLRILQQPDAEKNIEGAIEQWMQQHQSLLVRWDKILKSLQEASNLEYHMLFIALRELASMLSQG